MNRRGVGKSRKGAWCACDGMREREREWKLGRKERGKSHVSTVNKLVRPTSFKNININPKKQTLKTRVALKTRPDSPSCSTPIVQGGVY